MENYVLCKCCNTESIVIENKLFFPEEKKADNIICPLCKTKITTLYTDGWFFVQTKEDYIFEQTIEEQKKTIKYVEELV
ncbi:hypothetical protein [Chryseobacterium candidae]|uniref:Cysteine-rich KTR n=1 Tax=Chryseobacterium candidae TaxID=1978493 RepID=A0ABY2R8Q2_9FLAO|nr:hypothetical protein [Chryseobacterium candidae]THV61982.1 hypothetical protein EK417_07190 [Chryseobacterium candidae]